MKTLWHSFLLSPLFWPITLTVIYVVLSHIVGLMPVSWQKKPFYGMLVRVLAAISYHTHQDQPGTFTTPKVALWIAQAVVGVGSPAGTPAGTATNASTPDTTPSPVIVVPAVDAATPTAVVASPAQQPISVAVVVPHESPLSVLHPSEILSASVPGTHEGTIEPDLDPKP